MTILGWIDFRKTGIKSGGPHRREDVLLFTDGRISVGNGKLTDAAPKLQVLDVHVRNPKGRSLRSKIAVGYAGTSALVALSTISFVSHVLKRLTGEKLPRIAEVMAFLSQALSSALAEYSSNQMTSVNAAIVVAGFDPVEKKTVVLAANFKPTDGRYEVAAVGESAESSLTLLSEPKNWDLRKRFDELLTRERTHPKAEIISDTAGVIERAISDISSKQPYGGQLQFCVVGSGGPRLRPTIFWDSSYRRKDLPKDWPLGDYRYTILGFDVFDLEIDGCRLADHEPIQLPDVKETSWIKR